MEKQKVIEKATKCLEAIKRGHGNYRPFGFVEFADKIYEEWEDFYATVVMMANEEQEWIPCSERLPEKGKDVIVTRHYDGSANGNKSCRYVEIADLGGCDDEIAWYSYSDEYKMHPRNHRVIAWMPLPEPAKLESE